jgi:hypothetical protein
MDGTAATGHGYLIAGNERLMPDMMTKEQYDAYIAGQIALGRDVSEYKPEIRDAWAAAHQVREMGFFERAFSRNDGEDLFGGGFEGQRMPWWRRMGRRFGF